MFDAVSLYKMKIHTLHRTQRLPITPAEAWDFFSSPRNLAAITPASMGFEVLSGGDRPMFPGQVIQYYVRPLWGIRMRWVTEITHVQEGAFFVDEQRFGPYAFWHHKHFFSEIEGGTEMVDVVDYALPYGFLGSWLHPLLVSPKLEEIFDFRQKTLVERFGHFSPTPSP